jgi:hypothetical protein
VCVCACVYVCVHVCGANTQTYLHIHEVIHTRMHINTHEEIHTHIYIRMQDPAEAAELVLAFYHSTDSMKEHHGA